MTCYQYLTENKINFTKADVSRIGLAACKAAKDQNINYPKIKQKEGKHTYSVSDFPDSFIPTIEKAVNDYFKEKSDRATDIVVKDDFIGKEENVKAFISRRNISIKDAPLYTKKEITAIKKRRKRIPLKDSLKKK